MKHNFRIFTALFFAALVLAIVPPAIAFDEIQEEEYLQARKLLSEENFVEAMNIFKELKRERSEDFRVRLAIIDINIDHARVLKGNNDPSWKGKVYTAFNDLKGIYRANLSSPEMYLSFAKCYALNNRFQKARKSLKKAFYFKPGFREGLIVQGDIYFDRAKELADNVFDEGAEEEGYRAKRFAIKSYEDAMNSGGLKPETKAMISYKLGDLYNHFRQKDKAKQYWSVATETDVESYWVKKSQDRLTLLN
jgi:tetratricopeptide (TPR) repeat protein